MKIIFPKKTNQHYWKIHYQYVLNIFQSQDCEIEFQDDLDFPFDEMLAFKVCIDGKWIVFEYGDAGTSTPETEYPIFKFHYKPQHRKFENIKPFLPVCFYNWNDVNLKINYTANNKIILNCQKPYGGAIERRNKLKIILKDYQVDYSITAQKKYWDKIDNCLVSVHVPGQNNNMLDRAQLQLMAFGCCTISPNLPEILPYNQMLIPNEHYIQCANSYLDLPYLIEWCKANRERCVKIGNNVKELFRNYFLPENLIKYLT